MDIFIEHPYLILIIIIGVQIISWGSGYLARRKKEDEKKAEREKEAALAQEKEKTFSVNDPVSPDYDPAAFSTETFAKKGRYDFVWIHAVDGRKITTRDVDDDLHFLEREDFHLDESKIEELRLLSPEDIVFLETPFHKKAVALHDRRPTMRLAALDFVNDPDLYRQIAQNDADPEVRRKAESLLETKKCIAVEKGVYVLNDDDVYRVWGEEDRDDGEENRILLQPVFLLDETYSEDDCTARSRMGLQSIPIDSLKDFLKDGKTVIREGKLAFEGTSAKGFPIRYIVDDEDTLSIELLLKNRAGMFFLNYDRNQKMPSSEEEDSPWHTKTDSPKLFFDDGLFIHGDRDDFQSAKSILEYVDPKFIENLKAFMERNFFNEFNLEIITRSESEFQTINLYSRNLDKTIHRFYELAEESAILLERYASVIVHLVGEKYISKRAKSVQDLRIERLITCRYCNAKVHVASNQICPACGGQNG